MYKVIILGSTGSLGSQTLEVLRKYPENFELIGLLANKEADKLKEQGRLHPGAILALGSSGEKLNIREADIIVNVIPGVAGIEPSLEALRFGKTLLLGNKESIVAEGRKIKSLLEENPLAKLIPLDSEHNAISEILKKVDRDMGLKASCHSRISSITLPCSGGPLFNRVNLKNVTPEQALAHPKWGMGQKVAIESATLINKGLEIIEAHYFFDLPLEKIQVKIHPECQIHGMVTIRDGATFAYFAPPDMREHIENALCRAANSEPPKRKIKQCGAADATSQEALSHLPGIQIVLSHFKKSHKCMRAFLQKEEAVIQNFLEQKISFLQIYELLKD